MNILNHSEVTLVDHMGDDLSVVRAARVSTGAAATKGPEADKKLLLFLWANHHLTPFEQVSFTFHVKTPIFVARQLFRHRSGAYNEASARYKEMPTEFFMPELWRLQNVTGNKQGSGGFLDDELQTVADEIAMKAFGQAELSYKCLLDIGVAKELARVVLPVSLYTEFFCTFNLRNLLHLIALRTDSHAQPEIQTVAQQMRDLIAPIVPWTLEAFDAQPNM
jgi:thymidylate synthase (FAD)